MTKNQDQRRRLFCILRRISVPPWNTVESNLIPDMEVKMEKQPKYQVIYADPPWRYQRKRGTGVAENHYPTMSMEELCALPVQNLADRDCALFLWVTLPMLREVWSVIESWGFQFKTVAFVWIKQNRKSSSLFWGMGFWTRSNAELCLLAVRGHPKRYSAGVHQVIMSHIEAHSKKPEEARRRIEQLMGDVPRIELFARRKSPGWAVWGNELESDIAFGKPCVPQKKE